MFGLLQKYKEDSRLEELEKKMKSAKIQGKRKCIRCGYCCCKRTCIPTPDELREIAKFLKMNVKEMIKKFFAIDGTSEGYFVKPLGENILDLGGEYIPINRTYNEGECVFLEGKKIKSCKIYPVRPDSARTQFCWKEGVKDNDNLMSKWRGKVLEEEFGIKVEDEDSE